MEIYEFICECNLVYKKEKGVKGNGIKKLEGLKKSFALDSCVIASHDLVHSNRYYLKYLIRDLKYEKNYYII